MLKTLFDYAPRALALLPPEEAHEVTLKSLELGIFPSARAANEDSSLGVNFAGLSLPNPVGIAAGFDKDARVPDAVLRLGCGFAEIGTVTPLPQLGQSDPTRLPAAARPRRHQSARLQQRRPSGGAGPAAAPHRRRRRRRQHRRQQGFDRPHRRLRARYRDVLRRRQLLHDQHILAQHAGLARSAGSRRAGGIAAPLARCARQADRGRKTETADSSSSWRPTSPSTTSAPSSCSLPRKASTASPYRTRRCRAAD